MYTADIQRVIQYRLLSAHMYADDVQAYGSCLPHDQLSLRNTMMDCIYDVTRWMSSNRLKLNPEKTEFMWCVTSHMKHLVDTSPLLVQEVPISPSTSVKLLGVKFDSELTTKAHVLCDCQQLFLSVRAPQVHPTISTAQCCKNSGERNYRFSHQLWKWPACRN